MAKIPGHKLALRHNGEQTRAESGWTATCVCGWEEYTHAKSEAQREYHHHLTQIRRSHAIREN